MGERDKDRGEIVEELDEVDGILKNIFSRGKYRPKLYEVEDWGPEGPAGNDQVEEDTSSLISDLMYQKPEWRQGLILMLSDLQTEVKVRKCLVFLHEVVKNAIEIMENTDDAVSKSVPFEANSAPPEINMVDWISVMTGLHFNLESPDTVRNIDYVDVSIVSYTNKDVLMSFCHFLRSMLGLSWTHLKILLSLSGEEGKVIFTTVAMLDAAYGISDKVKAPMMRLESKYPSLLKSLGFQKGVGNSLQWQKPFDPSEYDMLFCALHGLFRPVEETVL